MLRTNRHFYSLMTTVMNDDDDDDDDVDCFVGVTQSPASRSLLAAAAFS